MSVYVYGIAGAEHAALPDKAPGVGDPPREVRLVREGRLVALISDCPDEIRPKRRDLLAHQHVLTKAGAHGAVLPLRFGSLTQDEESVRRELGEHAGHYERQLQELGERSEYNLKAVHREEEVLRLVVRENEEAHALAESNRASGGGTHEDRLRLGELIAQAVREHEVRDAAAVENALAPLAERSVPGPEGSGWLANLSFLLDREAAGGFLAGVEQLREANPHLDLQVSGPLPPYSFVAQPARAAQSGAE